MRIVHRSVNKKSKAGEIVFIPSTEDDLWYLYNIILAGDVVQTSSERKVKKQSGEYGVTKVGRKRLVLTMLVLSVHFQCDDKGTSLYLKTKNYSENDYVAVGQLQSTEVLLNTRISVYKERWDARAFSFVDEAAREKTASDTLIVLMEDGHAGFYFLRSNFTALHSQVNLSIPRRKGGMREVYEKKVTDFDRKVWTCLYNLLADEKTKLIVLAGPGTPKQRLMDKLRALGQHEPNAEVQARIKKLLPQTVVVGVSSVHKSSLDEVLSDSRIAAQLADTRALKESKKLEEFFAVLGKNSHLAVYGQKEVQFACEQQAVKDLLITDGVMKAHNFTRRQHVSALVQRVQRQGGTVFEFHEHHASGQKLKELTGLAAILKYPLELEETLRGTSDSEEVEEVTELPLHKLKELMDKNADIFDED